MVGKTKDGVIYFSCRYTDVYGNVHQKKVQNKSWTTLKQAKEEERKFLDNVSFTNGVSVDALFNVYYDNLKNRVKPRTLQICEYEYRLHIKDFFDGRYIDNLTKFDFQRWQNYLYDKGLCNSTLLKLQQRLNAILDFGVKFEIISRNPFTIPYIHRKESKKEMDIWSVEDFNKFIVYARDIYDKAFFTLLFYTGCRLGEALGLTIDSYDGKSITINKQRFENGSVGQTKNNKNRVVGLNKTTCEVLNEMISTYSLTKDNRADWLFCGMKGVTRHNIRKRKDAMCEKANVKAINLHNFRHSHASYLLKLGFSYVDVAKRLGDTAETIIEIYGHAYEDSDSKIVDALNRI